MAISVITRVALSAHATPSVAVNNGAIVEWEAEGGGSGGGRGAVQEKEMGEGDGRGRWERAMRGETVP